MVSDSELVVAVLFSFLIVIDVTANILVCLVVYRTKRMRRPMNFLLVNLAVADIIIGLFMLPRHVFNHAFTHPAGSAGDLLCKFVTGGVPIWLSAAASAIILIAIAAERYFAIVFPLRNRFRLNRKKVIIITLFSWGFACLLSAPSMAAIKYDNRNDFCVERWSDWYPEKAHVCFVFFVNCVFSIVSITFLYFKIIHKLWSDSTTATSSVQAARLKARKRVTVMLVFVTSVHTLCWAPNYFLYLLIFFVPGLSYGSTTYIFTVLLILLNAAADPLLYTWYMDGFKRGIQSMLRTCNGSRVQCVGSAAGQDLGETPGGLIFSITMGANPVQGLETSNV